MNKQGYVLINLLPYREKIKKEKVQSFAILMAIFALLGAFIVFLDNSYVSVKIEHQTERNDYIKSVNNGLDQQIKSIADLKEKIKSTLAKRKVVEDLQKNRSDTVKILNDLANSLPDGVSLNSVAENKNLLTIVGTTDSNDKVSNYMLNLAQHKIFTNPNLIEIQSIEQAETIKDGNKTVNKTIKTNQFILTINLKSKDENKKDEKNHPFKMNNRG
jgi:type IV pilus assembly protein PilN